MEPNAETTLQKGLLDLKENFHLDTKFGTYKSTKAEQCELSRLLTQSMYNAKSGGAWRFLRRPS